MSIIILTVGLLIVLAQVGKSAVLAYSAIGCAAIYLVIVLWVRMEERVKSDRAISNIKEALVKNIATVIHCQSDQLIRLDEIEDEGPHYFFQVGDNEILALGGQEYYENDSFPNTDFEIVTIYGKFKYPVFFEKYLYGKKIKPKGIVTKQEKAQLMKSKKYPNMESIHVLEGKLENISKMPA